MLDAHNVLRETIRFPCMQLAAERAGLLLQMAKAQYALLAATSANSSNGGPEYSNRQELERLVKGLLDAVRSRRLHKQTWCTNIEATCASLAPCSVCAYASR